MKILQGKKFGIIMSYAKICMTCLLIMVLTGALQSDTVQCKEKQKHLEKNVYEVNYNEYMKGIEPEVFELIDTVKSDYGYSDEELEGLYLGEKYIICDLDESVQDEIYYVPVINKNNDVVFVLSIMGTSHGWKYCMSDEFVYELNNMRYPYKEDVAFFEANDSLMGVADNLYYCLNGKINNKLNDVIVNDNDTELENKTIKKFRKKNLDFKVDKDIKMTYTPTFSEIINNSTKKSKVCGLNNPKGQGKKPICWAATVATIVNYRKGTNYSAVDVANKMGYNENNWAGGATDYTAQNALSLYGLYYPNYNSDTNNMMTWNNVKLNIDNKYPFYLGAMTASNKSGHAVTCYGYREINNIKYIIFWNSGSESTTTVLYSPKKTTFSYNGKTFIWKSSVSVY